MHPDSNVLGPHVFALSSRQVLEREQLFSLEVKGDGFGVNDERLHAFFDALCISFNCAAYSKPYHMTHARNLFDQIRVFCAHILRVSAEHSYGAVVQKMNL